MSGGLFPVQTLVAVHGREAVRLHRALARRRVLAVLRQDAEGSGPRLTFLLSARHDARDIAAVAQAVARSASPMAVAAGSEP